MNFIKPGRAWLLGFIGAGALAGGGAVAVSLQGGDEAQVPPVDAQYTTAPTASAELDSLGLQRLEPQSVVARETHGRLRVVPAGGPIEWDSAFEPQANLQAGELPERDDSVAGLPTADGQPSSRSSPLDSQS